MDADAVVRHIDPLPGENPWVHGTPPAEAVEIVAHDPRWPEIFRELRQDIVAVLGAAALAVEHVGSTAVPGLAAKPVVDIDLMVADPSDEGTYVQQLEALGYDLYIREPSWHQHRCLRLASPRANLHVFGPDCPEPIRHRMFREWLQTRPDDRELYERAKRAAAPGAVDVAEYNLRKQLVIREIYARMFRAAGIG